MSAARWTGVVGPHPNGGFVAYGDYLTLNRELSTARAQLITYSEFFDKHALGPKAAPSCMCCGQSMQGREPAIQHMELPGIVICFECRDARAQLAERPQQLFGGHTGEWLLARCNQLADELKAHAATIARLRADAERRLQLIFMRQGARGTARRHGNYAHAQWRRFGDGPCAGWEYCRASCNRISGRCSPRRERIYKQ